MKIQIIGVGVVGSTIANNIIIGAYDVDSLILCDVDEERLLGQFRDLCDSKNISARDLTIIPVTKPEYRADIHIICVGERVYKESVNELMAVNFKLVKELVKVISGKILIVTNPSDKITRLLKFKGYDVEVAGNLLDKIREGRGYTGKDIRLLKGYTNFGISAEILKYIKLFKFQKPKIIIN